ncbi:hypothetical protein [Streptococcus merionis]|uniref:hypothetical protein n=1 Tax=Streptococcus merionis TaxID=400065 RepID=UPI003515A079
MNTYSREELLDMFGYSFQVLKTVEDLDEAIKKEQERASRVSMSTFYKIKSVYVKILLIFTALCIVWGLLTGARANFWQMIIVFGLYYIMLRLLFSPIMMVLHFIYSRFANKAYKVAADNEASNQYREQGVVLLQDKEFLSYKAQIPKQYFNINDLYLLYSYLENYRADNFKEAANLLAEEQHRNQVEYNQQIMQQSLTSIERNAQYQSVIQTIHLLETRSMRTELGSQLNGIQNSIGSIFRKIR